MSSSHLSFDDSAQMAQPEQYHHYDLAGYPLAHQHSLAAYMQDVLQNQSHYPVSAPSPFTQYWGDSHSALSNPYLENPSLGYQDQRPAIHEPAPTRPISPGALYRSSLPWNNEHDAQPFMGATSESAPSTSNTFYDNVFTPQSFTFPAFPISTPKAEPQPSSSGQPWDMGAMAGSLDVKTGVYQRVPEHPRVRTAQACEKCRARKAKCSGEKPCQRCRNRNLVCEYAAERKMRGPNKVKRKSVVEAASARRASIVSTVSTASSSDDQSIPLASSHELKRISTLSTSSAETSSTGSRSPVLSSDGHSDTGSPRRARPPRIDLSQTNVYDVRSQIAQSGFMNEEVDAEREHSAAIARRNSLPPYLLESYSRVALTARPSSATDQAEATPRASDMFEPFTKFSQGLHGHKLSHSRSSSGTSVSSVPITPIHVPVNANSAMFSSSDLFYQQDLQSPNSQLMSDMAGTSPFGSLHQYVNEDWTNFDLDATPTIASSTQEKNLAQADHEMF